MGLFAPRVLFILVLLLELGRDNGIPVQHRWRYRIVEPHRHGIADQLAVPDIAIKLEGLSGAHHLRREVVAKEGQVVQIDGDRNRGFHTLDGPDQRFGREQCVACGGGTLQRLDHARAQTQRALGVLIIQLACRGQRRPRRPRIETGVHGPEGDGIFGAAISFEQGVRVADDFGGKGLVFVEAQGLVRGDVEARQHAQGLQAMRHALGERRPFPCEALVECRQRAAKARI